MLGHKVFQRLIANGIDAYCTVRNSRNHSPIARLPEFDPRRVIENIDVLDDTLVHEMLAELRPATIVNCVGLIKQRAAATAPIPSLRINSLLPHELANACKRWNGRLIHFSTDCVFSGRRGNYTETDLSDAEDLYGKTKFLGEVQTSNALTLRTSIIGRELSEHRSLLDWFLAQADGTIRGFRRVIYSGITTSEMSKLVMKLIADRSTLSGLYQVASTPISKHDLLVLVRDAYKANVEIIPDDNETSDRSMSGAKFFAATGWKSPSWADLVTDLASDPTPYKVLAGTEK
jgi:dTDP-4-dehydrorhamnose reductase